MDSHDIDLVTDRLVRLRDPMHLPIPRDTYRWARTRADVAVLRVTHLLARALRPTMDAYRVQTERAVRAMARFADALRGMRS